MDFLTTEIPFWVVIINNLVWAITLIMANRKSK